MTDETDDLVDFLNKAEETLQEVCGFRTITRRHHVSGGIVNKAAVFDTDRGPFFIKYSKRSNAFDMFESERLGLERIQETATFRVPKPEQVLRQPQGGALFLMEYMEDLKPLSTAWQQLGHLLGRMHSLKEKHKFGNDVKTFYGPEFCVEPCWTDSWHEYVARCLIQPQFEQIQTKSADSTFRHLWSEIQLILDVPFRDFKMTPSLLHGDFCSINVGQIGGDPVLFDPCCLYAPSEFDLGILEMESNFPAEFWQSYRQIIPKEVGYEHRMSVYKMFAYLLIHNIENSDATRNSALQACKEFISSNQNSPK